MKLNLGKIKLVLKLTVSLSFIALFALFLRLNGLRLSFTLIPGENGSSVIDSGNQMLFLLIATAAIIILGFTVLLLAIGWLIRKNNWYVAVLDSIPFPLSITDNDRNWTFINKPVEDMLGKKRDTVLGQPCSNWGAAICNTDNCGINCIMRDQSTTTFEQFGMNFKVDITYIKDAKGQNTGHIELVQDISELVKKQEEEAELVKQIGLISESFVTGSKQIANGAQALAQGATEQAATVGELSATTSEISDKTLENSKMAHKAANLAGVIKTNAEKGSSQMNEMVLAATEITQSSQSIGKVIKVIDDIAFQTNILALNAAVEAARAGQHGKGFAVVAEEVRNLAAKSAEAAKDTGSLIANSIEKAELGARIAVETADSLGKIVAGINESSQFVMDIARLSDEQSVGASQINAAIGQVSQVVQQTSATTEESAAASIELNEQAARLEHLIWQFNQKREIV